MQLTTNSISIKKKLIGIMTTSSLLFCGGFGYALVHKFEDVETSNLINVEIPAVIEAVDAKVEGEIEQLAHAAYIIGESPFISREFSNPDQSQTEAILKETLKGLTREYGFTDASVINANTHQYWNQDGFLKTLNQREDSWYFQAQDKPSGVDLNVFREADGTAKIFVNYRNLTDGVLSATSKTLDDIEMYMSEFNITEGTEIYLVDSKGLVKTHSKESFVDRTSVADLYSVPLDELFDKSLSKVTDIDLEGGEKLVATSYIGSLDWYVVVEVPKDEAFALVNEAKTEIVFVTTLIALLAALFSVSIARSIVRPIESLAAVFKDIGSGEGDLTTRIPVKGSDEIADLSEGFNSFIGSIHSSVKLVAETSEKLANAATSVNGYSNKTLELCDYQSDITIQTVTAINQVGATVNEIASSAAVAAEQAAVAEGQSQEGHSIVVSTKDTAMKLSSEISKVSETMSALAENTTSIESILDVIRGISEQTNLLALNAAIEAARAGEHGRGFSVVADEVRLLAGRTNDSLDDIQNMITSLQKEASQAVDSIDAGKKTTEESTALSESARNAISTIANSISDISGVSYQVAAATEEQATVVDELNKKVDEINQITQDNRTTAGDLSLSSEELRGLSDKLNELVDRFKI